jgi:hypothetical protein
MSILPFPVFTKFSSPAGWKPTSSVNYRSQGVIALNVQQSAVDEDIRLKALEKANPNAHYCNQFYSPL